MVSEAVLAQGLVRIDLIVWDQGEAWERGVGPRGGEVRSQVWHLLSIDHGVQGVLAALDQRLRDRVQAHRIRRSVSHAWLAATIRPHEAQSEDAGLGNRRVAEAIDDAHSGLEPAAGRQRMEGRYLQRTWCHAVNVRTGH
jgi:hypothetical protein